MTDSERITLLQNQIAAQQELLDWLVGEYKWLVNHLQEKKDV